MEVETKFRTDDLEGLKEKLINIGATFSDEIEQVDYWYGPKENIGNWNPGSFMLRVRCEGDKCLLTSKELTDRDGVWNETELEIRDPDKMIKIFNLLKLEKIVVLKKKRIPGRLGEFELCLDDVEGLGKFLEVALESDDPEDAKKKINELMKKIGINEDDVEHRGYLGMMFRK